MRHTIDQHGAPKVDDDADDHAEDHAMTTMRLLGASGAILAALLSAPGQAIAHGDKTHTAAGAAVKKEQKPWGIAGDARAVRRSVQVTMGDDMRFRPARIVVRPGETVRFVVRNRGQLMHEFVIGTKQELDAHAALMAKFPDMEHDEPYMAHVPPGQTGEIVWTFNRPGEFDFACLIAGHYSAGMVGRIIVGANAADSQAGGAR